MDMENEEQRKMFETFGTLFLLVHRWRYLADRALKTGNITTKQWLMLAVINKLFDRPPGIKEVAAKLYTSHQNVKMMALQLEKRGFLTIKRDEKDKRFIRLKTTPKNDEFWEARQEKDEVIIRSLFSPLTREEMDILHGIIMKLFHSSENLKFPQELEGM